MKKTFAIMVALVALVAFTAPAWAADEAPGPNFTVGGRMLTDVGYHNVSKEFTANKKEDVTSAFVSLGNTSYLRGTFTSADKTTGGVVELSMSSKINNAETVGLRFAYGWWKVGNCKLYAGQTDNWLGSTAFAPKQYFGQTEGGKNEMTNWGHIYGGRNPQAGFQWESGMFGFQIALVQPGAEKIATLPATVDAYANLPRIDLALKLNAGGFLVQPGFGWSQLKMEGVASGADDNYTSMIFILPVKFSAGPFTAKVEGHWGKNIDGEWSGGRLPSLGTGLSANSTSTIKLGMPEIKTNGKIEDTTQVGGIVSAEFKILPVWTAAAGFGIEKLNNDAWKQSAASGGLAGKDDNYTRTGYFVSLPYEVTKNFTVHPEFAYYNYGDNPLTSKDYGTEWLAGLQFRFVF
jgi:hypothetical protein